MLGIVSVGRSLIIRQLLLTALVAALGAAAYATIGGLGGLAPGFSTSDPEAANLLQSTADAAQIKVVIASAIAALTIMVVSIPVIYFTIGRPMRALAATAEAIARGDRTTLVSGASRNDEIGAIARALSSLRDSLAKAHETAPASEAEAGRNEAMRTMADKMESVSAEMAMHVSQLTSMTKRLSGTSGMMMVTAERTVEGSSHAATASSNAAGDVSSVATASEQLLDSIEEISRQVVQSTNVVKTAVERAVETNAGMGRLSAAAQKVGDVVSLISRIAAQTNLLALNATIEAARAGEAGRGFAVVAQEVKTLATQTAKATQDITGQIAEMQEATELSVVAIDNIQKKIAEVEHISTIIAAAVHEQGAATQEIARNVRSAAAGTSTITSQVETIARSADETRTNATALASLAHEFDDMTAIMSSMFARIDQLAKASHAA